VSDNNLTPEDIEHIDAGDIEISPEMAEKLRRGREQAETGQGAVYERRKMSAEEIEGVERLGEKIFGVSGRLIEMNTGEAYPYESGDVIVLGPEIFVAKDGSVINWNGKNYVPQKVVNLQPPLKEYAVGEVVEVDRHGDWLQGRISSKQPGILNVDTERGPVTVGGPLRIRKLPKA
jgi:hypothetical protein